MSTKQPKALTLAEWLEGIRGRPWPSYIPQDAAAELRSLHTENDTLRAGYDAARREIASLQAQAQQCGAGAGCCAQAARIAELEAQLEAVATPAQPLHVAAISCPHEIDKDKVVLHYDRKQPGKNALAQLAARLQAAQAQLDAVAQAVAAEREACAQLAAQTVCDLHIPTGVKIYGSRAAKAIRARGTDAAKPAAQQGEKHE